MKTKLISKRTIKTSEEMLTLRLSSKLMKSITKTAKEFKTNRSSLCRGILEKTISDYNSFDKTK